MKMAQPQTRRKLRGRVKGHIDRAVQNGSQRLNKSSDEAVAVLRRNEQLAQVALSLEYQRLKDGGQLPSFPQAEFSCYSQNNEDGILLLIFSVLRVTQGRCVEICAGDGIECNSANLINNHGWDALLIDGDEAQIRQGEAFYARRTGAWRSRRLAPQLVSSWVTKDNVNSLCAEHGFTGEIDLLTLDLDGMDFWIWDALEVITPTVVVAEYNNRIPPNRALTVPYDATFVGTGANQHGIGYFGASLLALKRLGDRSGYRLVGANGPETNAFFIRSGVGESYFPEVSVEACLSSAYAKDQRQKHWKELVGMQWVEV